MTPSTTLLEREPPPKPVAVTSDAAKGDWLQLARALFDEFDWRLTDAPTLVGVVKHKLEGLSASPRRVLVREYYAHVYAACSDAARPDRRERAFTELAHMLYRVAVNAYPDVAADVVNAALALIWEQLGACRWPETFFDFALYKLRAAATSERRFKHHNTRRFQVRAFAAFEDDGPGSSPVENIPSDEADALDIVHDGDRVHALMSAIEQLKNPNQREVLLLGLVDDMGDADIARRLRLSPNNVRKLRFDAIRKLRQDEKLKHFHD